VELTQNFVNHAILEAKEAAYAAADDFFRQRLNGVDQYACGFAWVNIWEHNGVKIKGNTKLGKMLKAAGVRQDYTKAFQIWNPSGLGVQHVECKSVGAPAAAAVLKQSGFTAHAGSRLD